VTSTRSRVEYTSANTAWHRFLNSLAEIVFIEKYSEFLYQHGVR
jgi:hypothetical protein